MLVYLLWAIQASFLYFNTLKTDTFSGFVRWMWLKKALFLFLLFFLKIQHEHLFRFQFFSVHFVCFSSLHKQLRGVLTLAGGRNIFSIAQSSLFISFTDPPLSSVCARLKRGYFAFSSWYVGGGGASNTKVCTQLHPRQASRVPANQKEGGLWYEESVFQTEVEIRVFLKSSLFVCLAVNHGIKG